MTDKPWLSESEGPIFFEAHGLPCAMRRGSTGAWCGYVGIAKSPPFTKKHPYFGKKAADLFRIACHGGVTYARIGLPDGELPDVFDDRWVIGFDTSHYGDLSPLAPTLSGDDAVYRTEEYVRENVINLAAQIRAVDPRYSDT